MTEDEFRQAMQELFLKFNKKDMKFNIFTFVLNTDTMEGFHFGFGCAACAAEAIRDDLEEGQFKHQGKSDLHVH